MSSKIVRKGITQSYHLLSSPGLGSTVQKYCNRHNYHKDQFSEGSPFGNYSGKEKTKKYKK